MNLRHDYYEHFSKLEEAVDTLVNERNKQGVDCHFLFDSLNTIYDKFCELQLTNLELASVLSDAKCSLLDYGWGSDDGFYDFIEKIDETLEKVDKNLLENVDKSNENLQTKSKTRRKQ